MELLYSIKSCYNYFILFSHAKTIHRGREIYTNTYNHWLLTKFLKMSIEVTSDIAWQIIPDVACLRPKREVVGISSYKWYW